MAIITQLLLSLGGVTLFLFGLKLISENMEKFAGNKVKTLLKTFTKNDCYGVLTGAVTTAVLQSSVATNVITVGFVSGGVLSFRSALSIVMGANIGTTVTAQLVALSGSSFNVTAIGALVAFIGFIFTFLKSERLNDLGLVMLGFGLLFFGLETVSSCVSYFKNFLWFRNIFLVKNHFVLLLNGILITALVQSSSAVTSVIIVLATNGLIGFENAMFLVLGSNIGTCFSVVIASLTKSADAQKTAIFNLAFNLIGALILFLPLSLFSTKVAFTFGALFGGIERQIANFHTLFNTFVTLTLMPFLTPLSRFISFIVTKNGKNKVFKSVKTLKRAI